MLPPIHRLYLEIFLVLSGSAQSKCFCIINIVMHHHERYDGSGYPAGLKGKAIPIESRIVAVADIFDALSSDRPYRPGFSPEETIEMIKSMKGKELDPKLVDILVKITH